MICEDALDLKPAPVHVENSSNELYTLLPLSVWRKSESRRSDTSVMSGIDARRDLWCPGSECCLSRVGVGGPASWS